MIPFKESEKRVSEETMKQIYELIKTPYKYGPVMKYPTDMCDSPTIYRHGDKWLMSFIKIANDVKNSGYDSHLAQSADLLRWEYLCKTQQRDDRNRWDSKQIALYAAFIENDLFGKYRLMPVNGNYYYAYLGGNLDGYETDPLYMGLCKTRDPMNSDAYVRFEDPIMSPKDPDSRRGETLTLYKSDMFIDEARVTGHLYVNAYNAKGAEHKESIFLSVSDDGEHWERYGDRPVIIDDTPDQCQHINGDPQIVKYGDIYVMFYFIASRGTAYDTFACSYDLINWTKWDGEPLIKPEEPWENKYAHKPCIIYHNDVLYHFYCAVGTEGRIIALATSKPLC